jgi:uncharacterized protein (TIGR00725 family)
MTGPLVAVIGGSAPTAAEAAAAEAVGRALAAGGAILVCGGRGGVMEAACRGARSAGGLTIGILPGTDRSEANPYVDIPIVTGRWRELRHTERDRVCAWVWRAGGGAGDVGGEARGAPARAHHLRRHAGRSGRARIGAGAEDGRSGRITAWALPAPRLRRNQFRYPTNPKACVTAADRPRKRHRVEALVRRDLFARFARRDLAFSRLKLFVFWG